MCKRNLENASVSSECCYGHTFNGSNCIVCPDGFTGQNCIDICDDRFYGRLCSFRCNCTKENCNHIYGCETDGNGRFRITDNSLDISKPSDATDQYTADNKTLRVKYGSDSETTEIQAFVTNFGLEGTTVESLDNARIKTSSSPKFTTSDNNFSGDNTLIVVIGGLIAFFLCILSIQACIKLHICRKRKAKRVSKQRRSAENEETYEEINEAQEEAFGNNDNKNQNPQHIEKYYELKSFDENPVMPYKNTDITLKGRYVDGDMNAKNDELCSSLISYDLNESCNSYLKPMNTTGQSGEKQENFEAMDTTKNTEDCTVEMTEDDRMSRHESESLQDVNVNDNGQSPRDVCDNNYLDVIHEENTKYKVPGENLCEISDNTYLDVINVSSDEEMRNVTEQAILKEI